MSNRSDKDGSGEF